MAYAKNKEIVSRIVHKHDTETNWLNAKNFIPMKGEIIVYDIDTTHEHERFKIGDGKTLVNDLPFQIDISDFENYKVKQEKVVDPSASGEALAFINTIMQDEMGVITVTKKNVGKVSTAGTADKLASLTVTLTGDVTGTQTIKNGNSISIATDLSETGVTAGAYGTDGTTLTYGDTFTVPNFSVDAEGRLTAAANKTFTLPNAQDLSNYKTKQTAVSNPTASGNATAFIDSISQNANGVITVTKKNVQFPNYDSTYKKIQTAVSSPTASGNTTAFIDTISQDAQGKITVTKKNVQFPDYSNTYQPKGNYKTVQTAVSDPTASGSASAFIDSISQDTNGKITVTKKNLSLPSVLKFIGTTTTTLTDGATTNPISIGGKSVTAVSGNVVILSGTDKEFLWTGSAWEEFGNASGHSIVGHTHTVSVSGSVSEFLGTVTKGKPTINVTVGTHPGVSVTAPTDEVLGSATTFTAASTLNSNVVTGGTTKYLGIGSVALNTDTVTEVTGNTDVTATNTVLGTATSASKITSSNVTAAGKTTAGTAISVPQYSFSNVTASKLFSAGSSTDVGASKVSSWSAGTISVSGETLTLALPSLSYSAVTASKVTLPTFKNATASKATAGTAISVPQHTHATDVTASNITANTSITVPVISSNTSVTASKVTTGDVTVATSVKTQPTLSVYTATATGRIKYIEGVSSSKPGITTTVTVGTNDKVNAVTSVSASTSSPTVTAALASDVVTDVAGKTKTVSLSGSAAASTN